MTFKKLLAPMVLAATLLSATPAFATSDWCWVDVAVARTECETFEIPANASGHFIYFKVNFQLDYRLVDSTNGIVCRMGRTGWNQHAETVFGLFAWYKLKIKGLLGSAFISNE